MRFDRFTVKAQEALQQAQHVASERNHQEVDCEHMLAALLAQSDGLIQPLLQKIGAQPIALLEKMSEALDRRPKVQGIDSSQMYIGAALKRVFDAAAKEAERLKDEYVSTEHILLGILDEPKTDAARALIQAGVQKDVVLRAPTENRGSQRVTDQNPEDKYRSLTKYGRDLPEAARKGKLDPVIGRDTEIRRTMQVLSPRTKNNPVLNR